MNRCKAIAAFFAAWLGAAAPVWPADPALPPPAFDPGVSLLRVVGGFLFVVGLFFLATWLLRRWQRGGSRLLRPAHRLRILEQRAVGTRAALYVVGYDHQRFLLAGSPAGLQLVSRLPDENEESPAPSNTPTATSFAEALQHVLARS